MKYDKEKILRFGLVYIGFTALLIMEWSSNNHSVIEQVVILMIGYFFGSDTPSGGQPTWAGCPQGALSRAPLSPTNRGGGELVRRASLERALPCSARGTAPPSPSPSSHS